MKVRCYADRFAFSIGGKQYQGVRMWTDEPWPWHEAWRYTKERATDEEVTHFLEEFRRGLSQMD